MTASWTLEREKECMAAWPAPIWKHNVGSGWSSYDTTLCAASSTGSNRLVRRASSISARDAGHRHFWYHRIVELTDKLQSVLRADDAIELAVLFGSRARSSASELSDVDVAILLKADAKKETLSKLQLQLADILRVRIDCIDIVDLSSAPPLLRFQVAKDGIVLKAVDKHTWSQFRYTAMRDWWDWAPFARRMWSRARRRLDRQVQSDTSTT